MKFLIIASKKDPAGMNIVENLKKLKCQIPIKIISNDLIYSDNIDKNIDADFIIFASKHRSEKEVKTLSVHTIGNFKKAEFGGKSEILCPSHALIFKHFFQTLNKIKQKYDLNYEVSMEATHHGPYIETPNIFIEIGSTENEWKDERAGKLVAETIIESIKSYNKNEKYKIAFGIGGPHYCNNFNEIQLNSDYALSFIMPEYSLPLTKKNLAELINKTKQKVEYVLVDWKGLGKADQRNQTLDLVKKSGLKIIRTSEAKISINNWNYQKTMRIN